MVNTKVKGNKIKLSPSDRVFNIVNYSALCVLLVVYVYPLVFILSSSFSSPSAVIAGDVVLFPVDFSTAGYEAVFRSNNIWSGYWNSLVYMTVGTLINVIVTMMAAYPLSCKRFVGKRGLMLFFTFTMIFNGGLIPTYLVVSGLDMIDTIWAMVLPGAMGVYFMIIARTFFQTSIPEELKEAAEISGCNDLQLIWHVVLPLSKSIIAVLVLFYAIGHWNSYFNALIYLNVEDMFPLQIVLREILIRNQTDATMIADASLAEQQEGLKLLLRYSLIVVATFPMLCIYPFVQKHFVKGVMIGSIKG